MLLGPVRLVLEGQSIAEGRCMPEVARTDGCDSPEETFVVPEPGTRNITPVVAWYQDG
jgi:hypothetical protein